MDDLSTFNSLALATEGKVLPLFKPDLSGFFLKPDGSPWTVTLLGADSPTYRVALRQMKHAYRVARETGTAPSEEEYDAFVAEHVVSRCIVAWDGITLDGKALEFSLDNAKFLLKTFPWFYDRVVAYVEDRANFTTKPSPISDGGSEESSGLDEPSQTQTRKRRK